MKLRLFKLEIALTTIIVLTFISLGNSQATFLYNGVCINSTGCAVTNNSNVVTCHNEITGVSLPRTRKTDGNCECASNNSQTCYDTSTSNFDCITPVSGKLSHADGLACKSSCNGDQCLASNFVCYSTSGDLKNDSGCKCDTSYHCYTQPTISAAPSCAAPGTGKISQDDYSNCATTATGSICSTNTKCWHNNRDGNNICFSKNGSPNLSNGATDGAECMCNDHRHCITYDKNTQNNIKCQESTYILDNSLVSRWSKNEYCRDSKITTTDATPDTADTLLCGNDDQCWHPENRVCTPYNAYGHSKGPCKMSQYILVLPNQIVDEGYDGEFHPVYIVNSFNDLYGTLGDAGLASLTSSLISYYNDNNGSYPDIDSGNYVFAHARKTFSNGDTNTINTFEYWSFGGNVAYDQYQQEQIKKGKYLWNWAATESMAGSEGLFMVFWNPSDTYLEDEGMNCYEYNNNVSVNSNDINRNDIRPLSLKMRYFYKESTARAFFQIIESDNMPAYFIKKTFGTFEEYGQVHTDSNKFVPDDGDGFFISIREILMGFFSPKCKTISP